MKTIINDYPNLVKYPFKEQFDYVEPQSEMIELLKEYLPIHCCIETVWNKNKEKEFEDTEKLSSRCEELRRKILEFDFYGSIAFRANKEMVLVRIYFDDEDEQKTIEFTELYMTEFEYTFKR